jgi:hypothetical protein
MFSSSILAQTEYPKDYFSPPLDILWCCQVILELRTQSFSCGFDFKTLQREGLNVHAVADGYVSE